MNNIFLIYVHNFRVAWNYWIYLNIYSIQFFLEDKVSFQKQKTSKFNKFNNSLLTNYTDIFIFQINCTLDFKGAGLGIIKRIISRKINDKEWKNTWLIPRDLYADG